MIYCSFCCIYVWLDPGTYMIARFMFFYKPGVTRNQPKKWPRAEFYDKILANNDIMYVLSKTWKITNKEQDATF